ncbi:hypothetical protein BLNAU_8570 [Blattamonas nauphoetae]|uniref:Uncharacterized protein n=1 Tax=Blattamonas nauphoetae TaxID=2049346 RepID=A0ABQ9XYG0_9EUKA|nr:hypothetical protein BLNAU_8570 [Blattamonas nauphoetae]
MQPVGLDSTLSDRPLPMPTPNQRRLTLKLMPIGMGSGRYDNHQYQRSFLILLLRQLNPIHAPTECEWTVALHPPEEENAMFEHIWGDTLFPFPIKGRLIFSTEQRKKLKLKNGEGDDVHLLWHSNRVYYRCMCGESFYMENGHGTIQPSFMTSFLRNRTNLARVFVKYGEYVLI